MIKIVVDSGCDLTGEMRRREDINLDTVPLTLSLGEKTFVDSETLDVKNYVMEMGAFEGTPKTAAPSPEHYMEKFKGVESIFGVTLTSRVSGSYNSAVLAKQMYLDEIGEKFIHIFDSLSAGIGETLIALKINEVAKRGHTDREIESQVTAFVQNMKTYFMLERYDNLVKTGRINAYLAKIAALMSFVPICHSDDGHLAFLDKARGFNRAVARLMDIIQKDLSKDDRAIEGRTIGISHVMAPDKALTVKDAIAARFNFKEIIIVETTGLVSTYADRGGIIVAF